VSEKRYLVLAEGKALDPHYGKTARGVILYGPHPVSAIVDSENAGVDVEGIPVVASVEDGLAVEPRANTALVGVALAGGRLPAEWRVLLRAVLEAGLDLESGMHELLSEDPELADLARRHRVEIRDLRKPPADLSVSSGTNLLQDAIVVLTVGSDCAIGKKSVAIELDREARGRGLRSVFVPTGQTGIAIAGWGIAVDAVVADFLAGAAERLVVEGARRGDLLFVEGQGSIVHPQFSGVALGLYHGSAPHLLVLCHMASATEIDGCPGHPIPPLPELVVLHEALALPARPARVAAIALNTHRLGDEEARRAIDQAEEETGLPADDPVRFGPVRLLDAVLQRVPSGIRTA
jgi:D-glutamate N-acetyltransferase